MVLAVMLKDRDALICDMAEYYHVLDIDSIPVGTLAALANGLPGKSRSVSAITGCEFPADYELLAIIADRLGMLMWMFSEDGRKNINRPESVIRMNDEQKDGQVESFSDGEDFIAAREQLLKKGGFST